MKIGNYISGDWWYITRQIPYTTSLKLGVFDNETYLESSGVAYDGIRLNWKMAEDDNKDQPATVRVTTVPVITQDLAQTQQAIDLTMHITDDVQWSIE